MELCGVYEQQCDCCPTAKYIGQMRVNFGTRMEQHRNDVFSNKPDENISGISKHARHCTSGTINWDEPKILATFNDKSKKALQQNCLLRENLEIRRQKTAMGEGLNDPQLFVKSNAWDPLLRELKDMWFSSFSDGGGAQRVYLSLSFKFRLSVIGISAFPSILFSIVFSPI